jgi:hypothetical protein
MESCVACERKFKDIDAHMKRNELCKKWILYLNIPKPTFDSKIIENIQKVYENIKR